jgi:glycosyltransferase involved in cell wall biosynthesis
MRLRRTAVGLSWIARAARLTVRARPALVHANDGNTMWAGLAAKLATGCALVYDSHELWADRNGRWEYRPWLIACEWLFVRFADAVTTTSPGHARALAGRYRIATPVVIRNLPERGVDPVAPEPVLAYVGGIMPGRGIEQAIDALALLPGVRIRATGPGAPRYRAALLARAELRGVSDRLELRSPVAPREVVDAIAGAAAGLCLIQPVCRSYELSLPNKLFEYLAAGVPVLCSDLPVMACVIGANGLGEIVDQADPEAIAAGARRLLCADRDLRDRVLRFGRAHLWEDEAGKLARLYGSLVRRRPSGPAART